MLKLIALKQKWELDIKKLLWKIEEFTLNTKQAEQHTKYTRT